MSIEKATERCKALTNPEQGCWIGISNQKAIEIVLEELENKQDDINILQAQRDSMEYQFKQAKSELEKKDKVINEMAKQLVEAHGWFYSEFDNFTEKNWIDYFTKKVEGK